jgi:hypothetical protein
MNLRSLFTEHPASVGETYFQHLWSAAGFAGTMFLGGMACLVHAIFPFAFLHTGSDCIKQLHERMVLKRHRSAASAVANTHAPRAHRAGVAAR